MNKEQIKNKVEEYVRFWGLEFEEKEVEGIVQYLGKFAHDEDELEHEMICEIRSLEEKKVVEK